MPETSVADLLSEIRQRGLTLAAAESCTGGLFSHTITNVPGASEVFKGSIVAYTGEVKTGTLGIPQDVLEKSGEASLVVAQELAKQAARVMKADIGVGITGNAGPEAFRGEVGEVYVCVHGPGKDITRELDLEGSRVEVKLLAVEAALEMIEEFLEGYR